MTTTTDADPGVKERAGQLVAAWFPVFMERVTWTTQQIADHQEVALRRLLRVAIDGSPFHADRLGHVDPDRFRLEDLPSLPIMTKNEMMGDFDSVVTDRAITRARTEEHLAGLGSEVSLLDDKYVTIASGGSSGVRGVFLWELEQFVQYSLAAMKLSPPPEISPGGTPGASPAQARNTTVTAASTVHATGAMRALFIGGSVTSVPASLPFDEVVARVEASDPTGLSGYPSMLVRLAEEKLAGRLRCDPRTVLGSSEPFTPEMKAVVQQAFGVAPANFFGASEGLMGAERPGDDALTLATDIAIVELVDDENRPVPPGTKSSKVLVTSLINHTQPLIRYELTDCMRLLEPAPDNGFPRVTVEGRADDSLRWGSVTVHPITVRGCIGHHADVREFQASQTARGLDVHVVASGAVDTASLANGLRAALADAGLADADVDVSVVPAIERHPVTGKVTRFVPLR